MGRQSVVELLGVYKIYFLPSGNVTALDGVWINIHAGEFVAIMGSSGSGKSTLLNQIGCLDIPTSGDLRIDGTSIKSMTSRQLTNLRLNTIGIIFQKFNLIPLLTAYENVEYPYILKHRKMDTTGRISHLMKMVGITPSLASHKPTELSGGQQQRVAIARALVNSPKILLCDEPTGNLDSKTGDKVMEILKNLHFQGRTLIVVTHDQKIAAYADRIITIQDGRII